MEARRALDLVAGAAVALVPLLCDRLPRCSALKCAACGALVILALFGLFDLDVPRRRGVVLAATIPLILTGMGLGLRRVGSWGMRVAALVLGIGGLASIHAFDGAPLRRSLPGPSPAAPAGAPSILLITLDTTRADALGCYGQERAVTPHIDALAALFTSAMSEAPHTHPAMGSLLTACYPLEHGSVSGAPHLAADVTTFAEHLRAQGYATAGFLDNPWLGTEFGLARGYEHLERRVNLRRIAAWLDSTEQRPFLLHVHLFRPHGPYELRRRQLRAMGGTAADAGAQASVGSRVSARTICAGEVLARHGLSAQEVDWIHDIYLSEVRAMDAVVGRLLELVDGHVIVALAADHGEEFGEPVVPCAARSKTSRRVAAEPSCKYGAVRHRPRRVGVSNPTPARGAPMPDANASRVNVRVMAT